VNDDEISYVEGLMDQSTVIAIVVGVIVLAAVGWLVWQRQRSEQLRSRYGPEYERTVTQVGDKRRAESELLKRQERVAQLDIRPLSAEQCTSYMQQWRTVQTRFVDDPKGAVTEADRLVEDVMKNRGYPISDFDQRAADLSVHHPRVVDRGAERDDDRLEIPVKRAGERVGERDIRNDREVRP
jgi:hypothetical protein